MDYQIYFDAFQLLNTPNEDIAYLMGLEIEIEIDLSDLDDPNAWVGLDS